MEQGRLLIITPFEKKVKRITEKTAIIRNKMMIEIADTITIGYKSTSGKVEKLLSKTTKEVNYLI